MKSDDTLIVARLVAQLSMRNKFLRFLGEANRGVVASPPARWVEPRTGRVKQNGGGGSEAGGSLPPPRLRSMLLRLFRQAFDLYGLRLSGYGVGLTGARFDKDMMSVASVRPEVHFDLKRIVGP